MNEQGESIKPCKSDEPKRLVTLAEVTVRATELAFVTATSLEHRTFFVQQCKYTNESLVKHNKLINDHCKQLCAGGRIAPEHTPQEVKVGDVVCTQYAVDGNWYRGLIKSCDRQARTCQLYFVDYGNYETVAYDYLVHVDPKNLPTIETVPCGFHCTLKGTENMSTDALKTLLDCLMEEYILIKPRERIDTDHWCIDIPKVAYNTTFWIAYQTTKGKEDKESSVSSETSTPTKVDCA